MKVERDSEIPVHRLLSPEGVRLDLQIAGPALRMLAYGIDFAVVLLVIALLIFVVFATLPIGQMIDKWLGSEFRQTLKHMIPDRRTAGAGGYTFGYVQGTALGILLLVQFVVETGYFIFWEIVTNGRSPGKIAMGLRVVNRNALPVNSESSVIRNFMRFVDMLPANYLVGLISILFSPSGERLGDHVAGTIVIRLDRPEAAEELDSLGDTAAFALTREQVAGIGYREMQLLRRTIRRASILTGGQRDSLISEVAETMCLRLGIAAYPGIDHLTFLRELLEIAERFSRRKTR